MALAVRLGCGCDGGLLWLVVSFLYYFYQNGKKIELLMLHVKGDRMSF